MTNISSEKVKKGFLSLPWSSPSRGIRVPPSLDLGLRVTGLGNMKLASDEEEVIPISNEGRLEGLESCSLSLIGKFLTCKPFNKRASKNTL